MGYLELLRRNPRFRRLWFAQVVSELGDWLNLVALLELTESLDPSAGAAGLVFIIELLPLVVWSPLAGQLADRLDRRTILVAADLGRAGVVLAYLFVDQPRELPWIYVLAFAQFSLTAFFEPARSALIPRLAEGDELLAANALSGLSWSVMLAIGGLLGGILTETIGMRASFVIDAGTFLLSALLIVRLPRVAPSSETDAPAEMSYFTALATIFRRPRLVASLAVKSALCITGGALWLLTLIYGRSVFPIGDDGAFSVGLFYGAHGAGAIVGALLTRRFAAGPERAAVAAILAALLARSAAFGLLALAGDVITALVAVVAISAAGSFLWVASTTMLQALAPDALRGRVFALDFAGLTLAMSLSAHLIGSGLDRQWFTPAGAAATAAAVAALVAVPWSVVWVRWPDWTRADK